MGLKPGRIVSIRQGFGIPAETDVTKEVIAYAGRRYAVTATGILLQENDRDGVILMQETKPVNSFYISAKARRIQEALLLPLEQPYLGREEENEWAASFRKDLL